MIQILDSQYAFRLFIQAISIAPLQVHYYSEALPTPTDTVSEFHAEASQATIGLHAIVEKAGS